jgi:hypothetical protein
MNDFELRIASAYRTNDLGAVARALYASRHRDSFHNTNGLVDRQSVTYRYVDDGGEGCDQWETLTSDSSVVRIVVGRSDGSDSPSWWRPDARSCLDKTGTIGVASPHPDYPNASTAGWSWTEDYDRLISYLPSSEIASTELLAQQGFAYRIAGARAAWAAVSWIDSGGRSTGLRDPDAVQLTLGPLPPATDERANDRCWVARARDVPAGSDIPYAVVATISGYEVEMFLTAHWEHPLKACPATWWKGQQDGFTSLGRTITDPGYGPIGSETEDWKFAVGRILAVVPDSEKSQPVPSPSPTAVPSPAPSG